VKLCVFEEAGVAGLYPLTATRPAFDLRCGATTLLEKHLRVLGADEAGVLVRPELAELCRLDHPGLRINDPEWLSAGDGLVVLVNARWLPAGEGVELSGRPEVGMVDGQVAFVVLPAVAIDGLSPGTLGWHMACWRGQYPQRPAPGRLIAYPWDLVEHNAAALADDFAHRHPAPPAGVSVTGPADRLWVDPSARVEPMVLIDTTKGPVMIDHGALVQAFSRVEGPCYVGPDTQVLAARVRGSSFGPQCRVGGEVEGSILQGYANKGHDGYLGHSYLGEWVNLAAGTQTSDLRADYGTIRFSVNGQPVDSGLIKVGSFVGDHAKTSLNVLFNTGSLVGPFGLLLTSGTLLPRQVPAFCQVAHGRLEERTDLRAMCTTAAAVMARRGREWTAAHEEFFFQLFESTSGARRQLLRDSEQRRLRRVV
jgi:UDP-N-acetylglucosamine diphosphorylase/glucosamine-1-phosphate N-acetyltransferase